MAGGSRRRRRTSQEIDHPSQCFSWTSAPKAKPGDNNCIVKLTNIKMCKDDFNPRGLEQLPGKVAPGREAGSQVGRWAASLRAQQLKTT